MTTHHTSDELIAEIHTYPTESREYNVRLEAAQKAATDTHNAWREAHAPMSMGAMLTCRPTPEQRIAEAQAYDAMSKARAALTAIRKEQETHTADDGYWAD
jgi:hypothetical protein